MHCHGIQSGASEFVSPLPRGIPAKLDEIRSELSQTNEQGVMCSILSGNKHIRIQIPLSSDKATNQLNIVRLRKLKLGLELTIKPVLNCILRGNPEMVGLA